MYAAVLFLHSWLRWLVLAAALVVLIRSLRGWLGSRPWTATDTSAGRIFTIVLDVQFLLGLILYAGLSPITWAALSDMGAAMRDGLMRYWAVEHAFGMIAAVVIVHVGLSRARRASTGIARHRGVAISVAVAVLIVLVTMPWPFSSYARPLLRW